jgi:hypothetical protein
MRVRVAPVGAFVVVVALVLSTFSIGASADTQRPHGWERRAGLDRVLEDTIVRRGQRVALGCVRGEDWSNLVLVGAERTDRSLPWVPVLTQRIYEYDVCRTCATDVATDLVPSSRALVAQCFTGGTNGVSHVLVAGSEPPDGRPGLLLEFSCGQTKADLVDSSMVITSFGPRGGAAHPGPPQPMIRLQWRDDGLRGASAADALNFHAYCELGQFYGRG